MISQINSFFLCVVNVLLETDLCFLLRRTNTAFVFDIAFLIFVLPYETLCAITHEGVLLSVLKVTLLRACFWRFLNCAFLKSRPKLLIENKGEVLYTFLKKMLFFYC